MVSFKNIILGIAIAIVFALAVGFGINAFYEEPKYEDFCKDQFREPIAAKPVFSGEPVCNETLRFRVEQQGQQCYNNKSIPIYDYDERGCLLAVRCDPCQGEYEQVREKYIKNLFLITIIIGIIGIGAGAVLFGLEPVGAGLMGGGVLSILYGSIRSFEIFGKKMQFFLLFLGLIILIALGYWINRRRVSG